MLSTRSLTLSEEGGLKATDFVAGVGVETVDFEPPVALVGQVESYLTALLKTQIDSLTNHMDRSIKRYVRSYFRPIVVIVGPTISYQPHGPEHQRLPRQGKTVKFTILSTVPRHHLTITPAHHPRYPTVERIQWLTTPCPQKGHNGRPIEPSQVILFVSALYVGHHVGHHHNHNRSYPKLGQPVNIPNPTHHLTTATRHHAPPPCHTSPPSLHPNPPATT